MNILFCGLFLHPLGTRYVNRMFLRVSMCLLKYFCLIMLIFWVTVYVFFYFFQYVVQIYLAYIFQILIKINPRIFVVSNCFLIVIFGETFCICLQCWLVILCFFLDLLLLPLLYLGYKRMLERYWLIPCFSRKGLNHGIFLPRSFGLVYVFLLYCYFG